VLWRFLVAHERCVTRAAGADYFPVVTTVPSGDPSRDGHHPLRWIVSEVVGPIRERYERLLQRTETEVDPHTFDADKFVAVRRLHGEPVLLIDDTWTTGANAQSAAAALQAAGAGPIGAVVIGRHVNREWHDNDRQLRALAQPYDWQHCAICAPGRPKSERAAPRIPERSGVSSIS
jgi:hypothetical protein